MNALVRQETNTVGDAELVRRCLQGDRDAFGQIVERHQSIVCALAYSACGDVALSEDLAQEAFLAAWRHLKSLHEPANLRSWLCGIVRNLVHNMARAKRRNPLCKAVSLEEELASGPEWDAPSDLVMSKEEEAILWRVLEALPGAYRDALVLFYRSGDSTAEVAAALALSEEAVRQRLARGRAMLNERVTRIVESGLRRSNPKKAFTIAVLAALPMASAQAAMAGPTGAAMAQGAGTLKTATGAGGLVNAVANAIPLFASLLFIWGHVENSRSERERLFLAWSTLGLVACSILWVCALALGAALLVHYQILQLTTRLSDAIGLSLLWLGLSAPLDAYVIWIARRQLRIRAEQAHIAERPVERARRGYRVSICAAMLAMVFGTTQWLFILAYRSEEWATILVLLLVTLAGWLASAHWAVQRPANRAQALIVLWWGLAAVNLATANLRWGYWHGQPNMLAPPGVNLLILVGFGSMRAGWWLKQRFLSIRDVRSDSLVALTIYLIVMAAGIVWFIGAKQVAGL